jgi:hypothetical protein
MLLLRNMINDPDSTRMAACYTCNPRGRIRELIIEDMPSGRFNFDLQNRPLLIFTTAQHWPTVQDMPAEELKRCFQDIASFMARINLVDYQIQINFGHWSNHRHAHLKVRADEQSILTLRFDHLARRSGMWTGLKDLSGLNCRADRVCDRDEDRWESPSGNVRDLSEDHAAAAAAREQAVEKGAGAVLAVQLLGTKVDGMHDERHDERVDGGPEEDRARDDGGMNHLLEKSVVS